MTRRYRVRINKEPKDEVIDLTDLGGRNRTTVVRSKLDSPSANTNDSPIEFIMEDKGQGFKQPYTPPDPDNGFEERLEAEGAYVINSITYYPASNTIITKKSLTPAEIAEKRGYSLDT